MDQKGDKMKFKEGDWVIQNYEIKQIIRMENGAVREVSCGAFSTSSLDMTDSVRPLTLRNKRYAESIRYYYNELRNLPGSNALNWPDINRHFSQLCLDAIDNPKIKYAEGEMNLSIREAQEFFIKTRDALEGVQSVDGIRLFRR